MGFIMENLPTILCAVVGILLLVVEMFMPGFGLSGISGIALLLAAIVLTWLKHGAYAGLGVTLAVVALGGLAVTLSLRSATRGRLSRSSLILKDDMADVAKKAAGQLEQYLGKQGIASTVLRPAGIAIIDGERVNVVTRGDFIQQGEEIIVEEVEGTRVTVVRAQNPRV